MGNTSKAEPKRGREIHYYRQRLKNRVFSRLTAFFAEEAESKGVSKKDIAVLLGKDQAQITRWLSSPTNLTLETISDILLALDAELEPQIVRFADRKPRNFAHPLIAGILPQAVPAPVMQMRSPIVTGTDTSQFVSVSGSAEGMQTFQTTVSAVQGGVKANG